MDKSRKRSYGVFSEDENSGYFDNELIGSQTQNFLEFDDEIGPQTQEFLEFDDTLLVGMDFPSHASSNLIGPQTQEFLEFDDTLIGECTQTFIEASQHFYKLPLYYQVGSGFENRPSTSSTGAVYMANVSRGNVKDAIIIEEHNRRKINKYKGEEICFRARVDTNRLQPHLNQTPICSTVLRDMFEILLQRSTEDLNATDIIRFCIQADGLDKPISTSLMPVSEFTIEKILAITMKVLQSKDEVNLEEGFCVDCITIRRDIGAGRIRKVVNVEVDRLNKRSILSIKEDDRGLCCAKAIIYALAHLNGNKSEIKALGDKRPGRCEKLETEAENLHRAAGVPLGPCTLSEIHTFEQHLNVQIAVFSTDNLNRLTYKGCNRPKRINLWLHNNHYDVIKSLKGFFATDHYCEVCEKPYKRIEDHNCPNSCDICQRQQCSRDNPKRCPDCDRLCQSEDCFMAHKSVTGRQVLSLCDRIYQCRDCCKVIQRRHCAKENHRCGANKCPSCQKFVSSEGHLCFLQKVPPKNSSDKLIFFDFETDQSSGEHLVNFAVAQYSDGQEEVFKSYSACSNFCSWLFSPKHKGFTAIAHNMKGFDGQFIMAWLLEQGTAPEVIPNGSMLMTIYHKPLDLRIIDSINFLPMALSKLPPCFGLSELRKGYFPHLFNTPENQQYIGKLPEAHFYAPDMMAPSAREAFLCWHEEHKEDEFNFEEDMLSYCRSDVDILRRCCLEFRSQFVEVTNVDPFRYITIASACMAVYRSQHIQPSTVAMIPVNGYINRTNFSNDSIRWLDFLAFSNNIKIQHALNMKGECKIKGISVDGFCKESKTVYQFHGCFYHGCGTCFDADIRHPFKGVTMGALLKKSREISEKIKAQGFEVVEIWEHDFNKKKKEDPQLQDFLKTHKLHDRLNPRDAFFGGRTNAVKLFFEGRAKYVDFTSLYPWVNKYCLYPVGHPEIITEGFGDVRDYFGLIHCRVIPPRGLFLPVLPYRCQKKLMFPLCRKCTESFQQSVCTHSDDERALVGTWVSEELKLAMDKGYHITDIYGVYHFENTSDSLFKSYIDLFLKIKQESSGWPSNCVTEEEKAQYIQQYEDHEGVKLDPLKITKNPGRRQVAKLALNSFWGRWGMNINKVQLSFVTTVPQFNKMMIDTTKNIKDVYFPSDEVAALQWEKNKEFVQQDTTTNIFLAAFTTAWARLKLYSEMDKLNTDVIYHDTDSIVYAQNNENDPPLGNFLGEFTDELNGDVITKFVSGGPKNYAFETENGKTYCKVRGFTLNFKNAQLLNFDTIKSMVCSMDEDSIPLCNPNKICREVKKRKVVNKSETKLYRVVYNKRVIQPDLSTLPYGY